MEKMSQQEYKSEALCSKVDLDIYDDLDLTLSLGLPNQVRGENLNNISQPLKSSTDLICSQHAMDTLNCPHNQAMKSSTMIVPVSGRNKENAMFSGTGSSTKQMSWPLMSNQSIMMNSRDLIQMSKAIIREAPAPSNITMMSISCNYNNMNNRIAYPPENQMNYDCYIILDPSKKTRGRSSSSSRKTRSKTKTKLQSSSPSDSRRGKSNTEFTKPDQRDPNKRCTNYNCGVRFSPMWRRGPLGPKSLCNACGIRFRKQEQKRMEEEKTANEAVKMAGSEISCTSTANTY